MIDRVIPATVLSFKFYFWWHYSGYITMIERTSFPIPKALRYLRRLARRWGIPYVSDESRRRPDPFRILIATILSSRTKDEVTGEVSNRLFERADTPEKIMAIPEKKLAKLIYPIGFYNTKARTIRATCEKLVEQYGSKVPASLDELLTLPGVGRKTANLVLTLGFEKHGICVDTHVHRISNRWGIVDTESPHETEQALRATLPKRYWIEFNTLLVSFGKNVCTPVSPKCSECGLETDCPQIGVTRHR